MPTRNIPNRSVALVLALTLTLTGCAAMQQSNVTDTEQILSAAGFQMKLADSPEKQAHLQTLTQHKLVPHQQNGDLRYVYADAAFCECLYAGDEAAYQRYQQMALQKNIADDQRMAAEMNEDAAMDWGMWGPRWYW